MNIRMRAICLLLILLSLCSAAVACGKKQNRHEFSSDAPYQNTDFSERFIDSIFASDTDMAFVYMDAVYFGSHYLGLCYVSTADLKPEVKDGVFTYAEEFDEVQSLCTDPKCNHGSVVDESIDCPVQLYSPESLFLLDAHESNGGYPIFYIARAISSDFDYDAIEEEGIVSVIASGYAIYRYDNGNNKRKEVIAIKEPIVNLAVYGDYIFYVTSSKDGEQKVSVINKSGESICTGEAVKGEIDLVGFENGTLYYADLSGRVYTLSLETKKSECIYTVKDFVILPLMSKSARMTVYDGYLYFDKGMEDTDVYPIDDAGNTMHYEVPTRTIARLPLSDLSAPMEIVAEKVFQDSTHGIHDGKLYYCKLEMGDRSPGTYWNFCGGTLYAVDLKTLESTEIIKDCGIQFERAFSYLSENFCVGLMATYSEKYAEIYNEIPEEIRTGSYCYFFLYDFNTGKLFALPI